MEKDFENYYVKQAGNGISSYAGSRYPQYGNGFFGTLLHWLKPALHYVVRKGGNGVMNVLDDAMNGKNIIKSAKTNFITTGKAMVNDGVDKLETLMKGKGVKRKKVYKRAVNKKRKTVKRKSVKKKSKKAKKLYKRRKPKDF